MSDDPQQTPPVPSKQQPTPGQVGPGAGQVLTAPWKLDYDDKNVRRTQPNCHVVLIDKTTGDFSEATTSNTKVCNDGKNWPVSQVIPHGGNPPTKLKIKFDACDDGSCMITRKDIPSPRSTRALTVQVKEDAWTHEEVVDPEDVVAS